MPEDNLLWLWSQQFSVVMSRASRTLLWKTKASQSFGADLPYEQWRELYSLAGTKLVYFVSADSWPRSKLPSRLLQFVVFISDDHPASCDHGTENYLYRPLL